MLPHFRSVASFAAVLGILVLATDAQAGNKLYSASLFVHALANDTTSGSTPSYAIYTLHALPLGAYCNPSNRGTFCGTETLHNGAPGGGDTIQLVAPRLTHWGDSAVLRVQFAPEPEGWLLLATGLSLVAVLNHSGAGRARRIRRSQRR